MLFLHQRGRTQHSRPRQRNRQILFPVNIWDLPCSPKHSSASWVSSNGPHENNPNRLPWISKYLKGRRNHVCDTSKRNSGASDLDLFPLSLQIWKRRSRKKERLSKIHHPTSFQKDAEESSCPPPRDIHLCSSIQLMWPQEFKSPIRVYGSQNIQTRAHLPIPESSR